MMVRITATDNESFGIDFVVSSLSYTQATGKYLMAAGGYDIVGTGLPQPVKEASENNASNFVFQTKDDALRFFDWLREADANAHASFPRMMD